MNQAIREAAADQACPKRTWVASILADDESMPLDGTLPQGLRFHLSQCADCRAFADRLSAVTGGLGDLSAETPPASLTARATEQAVAALAAGGALSGRTTIRDYIEPTMAAGSVWAWQRFTAYAAAAVILISVTLFGVAEWRGSGPAMVVDGTAQTDRPAQPRPPESSRTMIVADSQTDSESGPEPSTRLAAKDEEPTKPTNTPKPHPGPFSPDATADGLWMGPEAMFLGKSALQEGPQEPDAIDRSKTIGFTIDRSQR